MTNTFCTKCASWQESFAKASIGEIASNRFPNWAAVKASADQGCSLCQIVYQSRYYQSDLANFETSSPITFIIAIANKKTSLYVSCEGSESFSLPLIADESDKKRFNDYKERCQGILDPMEPGSLDRIAEMASKWLQECRQNHRRCGVSHNADQERILPTRLIDVGLDTQQPKLINTDHDLLDLEYLILSYAWGPAANFAKTTASNVEAMNQSLPWNRLPKTAQDAILFTRKLGVRYLWIDALCILQNEGEDDMKHRKDWSYEAERFGHYYQNALITISATGAVSSHEGLFLPRSDLALSPRSLTLPHIDLTLRSFLPSWDTELRFPPLASRGWALQERFLSKRILHFGPNLILWECHDSRASEIDTEGLDPKGLDGRPGFSSAKFLSTFRKLQNEEISPDLMDEWLEFISVYTLSEFSYHSDRLPALSGIATITKKKIHQDYWAGLWEPVFKRGLIWFNGTSTTGHGSEVPRSKTQAQQLHIPSWSWAASRQFVFFPDPECWKAMCEIVERVIVFVGGETSGQLLTSRLRLRGSVVILNPSDMGFERHGNARVDLFESSRGRAPMYLYLDESTGTQIPYSSCPCMLIGVADNGEDDDDKMGFALVLQSTGRSWKSFEVYRRIGILEMLLKDWKAENPEEKVIELV